MAEGLSFGTIMEIASGIMNSLKSREEGKSSTGIDPQKLAMTLGTIGARMAFTRIIARRQRKAEEMEKALAYLRELADTKKKRKGPSALIFFAVGLIGGIAIMYFRLTPEERSQMVKSVDSLINEVTSMINEFQGRPYSSDYELKKG